MMKIEEKEEIKLASLLMISISILLLILKFYSIQIFENSFEIFIIHLPALISLITYIYIELKLKS
ncbi:MAG: hypothetical protein N3E39_01025 [Candidatus Methanomethylicia archaeon]|nr:hypothetical protein [Candidatus Methanomethylicia archaeon]